MCVCVCVLTYITVPLTTRCYTYCELYITLNSLYDYCGSENAAQLKNNSLVGQMNELRSQIIAKDWLSELEPIESPFQQFRNYQCWKYIGEVKE